MRVLVTGGAGFIGSHIVDELLTKGHEPFVIDDLSSGSRKNVPADVPFFEVDIREPGRVKQVFDEVQPEWVCHQAAQMSVSRSVREPVFDAGINVMGLLNVFDNAARVGVRRVVFASSGGVLYGDVFEPAPEEHPANPVSPYGISKWVGEQYLKFYTREHGLQTVALRYANVYGPRQNPHGEAGVVAIFSERMLQGESSRINGDGKYIRDYVYVTDVAHANVLALETELTEKFEPFNVGTGIGTDVNELADHVYRHCAAVWQRIGREGTIPQPDHGPARAGDLRSNVISAQKAGKILGWQPTVDLETGFRQSVDWFARKVGLES